MRRKTTSVFIFSSLSIASAALGCSAEPSNNEGESSSGGISSGGGVATGGLSSGGMASGGELGSGGTPSGGMASGGEPGSGGTPSGGTGTGSTSGVGGAITGGASGTGAAAGMGGTGGDSGVGGTSGTGGNSGDSGCDAANVFCEMFESYGSGTRPSGGMWLDDPCGANSMGYSATAEAGAGLDGSAGFVTTGASSSTNHCVVMSQLDVPSDFWVTVHIKIGGPNPDMEHEVTFFELGEVLGDDPELRIGYRGDSSCSSQGFELGATKGPGGEFTGCTGNKPVSDTWYCLETHVDQSGGSIVSQIYVDGVKQETVVHGMLQENVLGDFTANYLKIGMQSYSGTFESLTLDDLSLSTTRVGCE